MMKHKIKSLWTCDVVDGVFVTSLVCELYFLSLYQIKNCITVQYEQFQREEHIIKFIKFVLHHGGIMRWY